MVLHLENPKDAAKQLLENSPMHLVKFQDTKLIHRNMLCFCTLTMNYQIGIKRIILFKIASKIFGNESKQGGKRCIVRKL